MPSSEVCFDEECAGIVGCSWCILGLDRSINSKLKVLCCACIAFSKRYVILATEKCMLRSVWT